MKPRTVAVHVGLFILLCAVPWMFLSTETAAGLVLIGVSVALLGRFVRP